LPRVGRPQSAVFGHLEQTRDWFATTPVALRIDDGLIISAKDSDAAETPDSTRRNRPERK
jgi:hypothetical protein